jgi:CRP-like cAMP-binding protein
MLEKEKINFEKTVIVGIVTQNQNEEKLVEYLDELEFEYYNGVYFCHVGDLKRGTSFGELALISADTRRNATIICETDCVFAVLSKASYDNFLHRIELIRRNKLIDFISAVPCFKTLKKI